MNVSAKPRPKASDYKSDVPPVWCPGCGDYTVLLSIAKAMAQLELVPEETVVVFGTTDAQLARKLVGAIKKQRSVLTFCYCSIFDECWLADSRKDLQAPVLVEVCPDFGEETYLN